MKENKIKVGVYISAQNKRLLDAEKGNTGKSAGEIIDALLDQYFRQSVSGHAKILGDDIVAKIDALTNKVDNVLSAANANYRVSCYSAELLNTEQVSEADKQFQTKRKQIARKKAMQNYGKLRSGQLSKEEFLQEKIESEEENIFENFKNVPQPEQIPSQSNEDFSQPSEPKPNKNLSSIDLSKYMGGR